MKIGRRGILGGILGAAAVAPATVMEHVGVKTSPIGLGFMDHGHLVEDGWGSPGSGTNSSWYSKQLTKLNMLKTLAPDWFSDKIRAETKQIEYLDLDLAAMVSLSPAAKINIQRDRQFKRHIEREEKFLTRAVKEEMFKF